MGMDNRLLVIFDMNGTLLYRARHHPDKYSIDVPCTAIPAGKVRGRTVYLRPFLNDIFASDRFDYAFWTSANEANANALSNFLPESSPQFIFNRDHCTENPNGEKAWSVFKDLDKIDKIKYGKFVLVDDTDEKLYRHHKHYHLHIPEYLCEEKDNVLHYFRLYLDILSDMDDYLKFMNNLTFDEYLEYSIEKPQQLNQLILDKSC